MLRVMIYPAPHADSTRRDDVIVLPSMAEHTLTTCQAATVSWYDGVGHMPFWEASDRFDRELAGLAHAARSPLPVRPGPL
jgi:pimeloyl-ACP methyl ester carboxylesterase